MSFLSILYTIFIMPLQLIFEELYFFAYQFCDNPGLSIIALSLVVNLLVLPLYDRADAMQIAERDIENKLRKGVEHIKKTFKGDEQLMILQTYYRQNNYSPTDIIKGSISLFLEIPFFVAAYQFLSHLDILQGVALGPIKNLGAPDALVSIAGITINILPILMTAINIVAAYIFTKDFPLKTKIQLQGMAIFFLIFLYKSPAGLVFYWTLNNLFNLVKTIIYKMENPEKGARIALFVCSLLVLVYGLFFIEQPSVRQRVFSLIFALLLNISWIFSFIKRYLTKKVMCCTEANNQKIFLVAGIFLSILLGAVIPSAVIEASPQEFVIANYFSQPIWYIVSAFCLAFGTFVVWLGVFYWLAPVKYKAKFDLWLWIICGVAICNYMFFGKNLGLLNSELQYETGLSFTSGQKNINVVCVLLLIAAMIFIWKKLRSHITEILAITSLAMSCMVAFNLFTIQKNISGISISEAGASENKKFFSLSKNGKNVIVLMMDRAMGLYVPYLFNEKPELKKQFAGFTYYSNTVSFGGSTNFGTPGLFGGYEYTPEEMNKRNQELLKDKHNEALKVMPVLFEKNNFDVTVCDLSYANYKWIPDLSIFKDYAGIKYYNLSFGKFGNSIHAGEVKHNSEIVNLNKRNFYCFAFVKCLPLFIQKYFYDNGYYNVLIKEGSGEQKIASLTKAKGLKREFMTPYNELRNLTEITEFKEKGNTALIMVNDIDHQPTLLKLPEYAPASDIDNSEYEKNHKDRFTLDGLTLSMQTVDQLTHYHVNMAAMLQLGQWFDYLRANGVYDNTRIIIVSDHGRELRHSEKFIKNDKLDIEGYYALLMVKDFSNKEFVTSEELMTNADVPYLAMDDIIQKPVNPFTGQPINNEHKKDHKLYIFASNEWNIDKNNGNTFKPGNWYSVEKDMRDKDNWQLVAEDAVLPY